MTLTIGGTTTVGRVAVGTIATAVSTVGTRPEVEVFESWGRKFQRMLVTGSLVKVGN